MTSRLETDDAFSTRHHRCDHLWTAGGPVTTLANGAQRDAIVRWAEEGIVPAPDNFTARYTNSHSMGGVDFTLPTCEVGSAPRARLHEVSRVDANSSGRHPLSDRYVDEDSKSVDDFECAATTC